MADSCCWLSICVLVGDDSPLSLSLFSFVSFIFGYSLSLLRGLILIVYLRFLLPLWLCVYVRMYVCVCRGVGVA